MSRYLAASLLALLLVGAPPAGAQSTMDFMAVVDFAKRYAAAWSSQDPELLASFYSPDGSLQVNDGETANGREAIAARARGFMEAFPDMVVEMTAIQGYDGGAEFHWLWTGTNTGPGGTGRAVRITGHEEWTFGPDNLIVESKGHYDGALYQSQVNGPEGAD